jgi:hypothetical protein
VDAPVRPALVALVLTGLLLAGTLAALPLAAPAARAAGSGAVTGTITGKSILPYHGAGVYTINGTGGPAVLPNGTISGNLTYYLSVTGANTTGVSISPETGKILTGIPGSVDLSVSNVSEVLTINVLLASVLNASNESTNFSTTVTVVQPYVLSTTLYNLGNSSVSDFPVLVDLDGVQVGNVTVATVLPHATFLFSFQYPTLPLSPGTHTFSISLTSVHGLVRFANGTTVYTVTFTIPSAAPNYTLWYVTGVVAFLGVLLIFGGLVGARRRSPAKK